jgi:hypothetical protein
MLAILLFFFTEIPHQIASDLCSLPWTQTVELDLGGFTRHVFLADPICRGFWLFEAGGRQKRGKEGRSR